jgi:hypothetical protein
MLCRPEIRKCLRLYTNGHAIRAVVKHGFCAEDGNKFSEICNGQPGCDCVQLGNILHIRSAWLKHGVMHVASRLPQSSQALGILCAP